MCLPQILLPPPSLPNFILATSASLGLVICFRKEEEGNNAKGVNRAVKNLQTLPKLSLNRPFHRNY